MLVGYFLTDNVQGGYSSIADADSDNIVTVTLPISYRAYNSYSVTCSVFSYNHPEYKIFAHLVNLSSVTFKWTGYRNNEHPPSDFNYSLRWITIGS